MKENIKPALQTIGILCLFVIAQLAASILALFLFNTPNLFSEGFFDINLLGTSASAVGFSMILTGIIIVAGMAGMHAINIRSFTRNGNHGKVYVYVILLMLPAIFLINLFSELLSLEDTNKEIFRLLMYNPLGIISIILTGPFTEELVFRMGIQTGLTRMGLSSTGAIILSSFIFGLIHVNPAQIPGAVVFGLILGWLYWRSGSIWLPVTAHILNNFMGVALFWLTGDSEQTITELCGGTWQLVFFTLLSLLLFTYSFRKLQQQFLLANDTK